MPNMGRFVTGIRFVLRCLWKLQNFVWVLWSKFVHTCAGDAAVRSGTFSTDLERDDRNFTNYCWLTDIKKILGTTVIKLWREITKLTFAKVKRLIILYTGCPKVITQKKHVVKLVISKRNNHIPMSLSNCLRYKTYRYFYRFSENHYPDTLNQIFHLFRD